MWKDNDIIIVILPNYQLIGKVYNSKNSNNVICLEFPFELISTPDNSNGVFLRPFGNLFEKRPRNVEIASCHYITVGKARKELIEIYNKTLDKIFEMMPELRNLPAIKKLSEIQEKAGKILNFKKNDSPTKNNGQCKIILFNKNKK